MAGFTERIQFVVDAVTGSAEKNLKGLRTELAQAEGFTGKAKAGIGSLATTLKDNLGPALLTGGAAVVAFGLQAANQFADTARAAGQLADTTRLTTEESSRWLAVLSQWGVEGNDLADILNNINAKAAEGALEEFGIQADNTNDRLIKSIEYVGSLTDETERARVASILFGEEGARQMAGLTASADTLRQRLAGVSDAQVITDEERKKAADYDKAMRDLELTVKDLSLAAGEALVPALTNVAESIKAISDALDKLPDLPGWLDKILSNSAIQSAQDIVRGVRDLNNGKSADQVLDELVNGPPPTGKVGQGMGPRRNDATVVNNTIYMPASTDGRDVDRGLQEYYRRNGEG